MADNTPEPGPSPKGSLPEPMAEGWDEDVGLWGSGGGDDAKRHDIRHSAAKLVIAGNLGLLEQVPAGRVLENLRAAQQKAGPLRGNFWWSWEDKRVTDRNSGFFTTIQLLALHHEYRDRLSEEARADLDRMLDEAIHWFRHKIYPIVESKQRYPNAYFGDAACLWLLSERNGRVTDELKKDFHRICRYYLDSDWGWGEHLSDLYAKVFQREVVALLLWSNQMPAETEKVLRQMMTELCTIDALFDGGPRVPTVRCYHLDSSPVTPAGRSEWFEPYVKKLAATSTGSFCIELLAYRRGLPKDFTVPPRRSPEVTVDSYGGSKALAWVADRWRIGALTAYPFFADMNRHAGYGLHWQAMPVAFWHSRGDWGYLQWAAEEKGTLHALPGTTRKIAQSRKLCRLSDEDLKASFGWTHGIRRGKRFLVLRRLPHVARSWPWAADRFRLVSPTAGKPAADQVNGWHRLVLPYGKESLTVAYHPIAGDSEVVLERDKSELRWGPRWELEGKEPPRELAGLWFLTVDDAPTAPPAVQSAADSVTVELGEQPWQLRPARKNPWRRSSSTGEPGR